MNDYVLIRRESGWVLARLEITLWVGWVPEGAVPKWIFRERLRKCHGMILKADGVPRKAAEYKVRCYLLGGVEGSMRAAFHLLDCMMLKKKSNL